MNILTTDIILVITSRNFSTIKHDTQSFCRSISYLDQDGNYHRINGPARIWSEGHWDWRVHGKLHRDQAPAMNTLYSYAWYNMDRFVAQHRR